MKKEDALSLGQRIKEIRQGKNVYHKVFNQKDFAKHIGATVQALSNWENGRNKPNAQRTQAIADIAGINVDELLENKNYINTKERLISKLKSDIKYTKVRIIYLEQKIDKNGLSKADDIAVLIQSKKTLNTLEKHLKAISDSKYKIYFYGNYNMYNVFVLDPNSIKDLTLDDLPFDDETIPWNVAITEQDTINGLEVDFIDINNKEEMLHVLKSNFCQNTDIIFTYFDEYHEMHSYNEEFYDQIKKYDQIIS